MMRKCLFCIPGRSLFSESICKNWRSYSKGAHGLKHWADEMEQAGISFCLAGIVSCYAWVSRVRMMPSHKTSQFTRGLMSKSPTLLLAWVPWLVLRAGKAFVFSSEGNFKEHCIWLVIYFCTGKTETMGRVSQHNFSFFSFWESCPSHLCCDL